MSSVSLIIEYHEMEDSFDVYLDGEHIGNFNHDDHGWSGMTSVRDALVKMAEVAGIPVETRGDPNV